MSINKTALTDEEKYILQLFRNVAPEKKEAVIKEILFAFAEAKQDDQTGDTKRSIEN